MIEEHDIADNGSGEGASEAPLAVKPSAAYLDRLLESAPSITMVASPEGTVTYINGPLFEKMGYRRDEVVGDSFFNYIEMDAELEESIGYALGHPGLLLPTLYKVRHKDGRLITCEVVANNALDDPMIGGLVVTFRTFDERLLLDQMLESVGLGAPVAETLELAVQVIGQETLAAKGAIAYHPSPNGFESCLATPGLPEILRGGPCEVPGAVEGALPWIRALHTRQEQFATIAELPAAVGSLCRTEGVVGCWALPIVNEGRVVACVIIWRTKDEAPEPAHRLAADRLVRHIGVALERDQHTLQLQHAALHDSLTSLPNRMQFFERLDREMARAAVDHSTLAVFYVDLDGFKRVNDLLGHAAGDEVLVEAARRIENTVRPGDLSARLGGDEFAVICPDIGDVEVAHQIAERLVHEVAKPISLPADGNPVHIGASVGVAIAQPADQPATVLEAADAALYEAKNAGKGRWVTAAR
jgi:diguanylate cyclase (GGDEF)-like protein/PAS domain S-box-containing protein